jgi:hypothetical protein
MSVAVVWRIYCKHECCRVLVAATAAAACIGCAYVVACWLRLLEADPLVLLLLLLLYVTAMYHQLHITCCGCRPQPWMVNNSKHNEELMLIMSAAAQARVYLPALTAAVWTPSVPALPAFMACNASASVSAQLTSEQQQQLQADSRYHCSSE